MNVRNLKNQFWRLGARVTVSPVREAPGAEPAPDVEVLTDTLGEHFHMRVDPLCENSLRVIWVQPNSKRLLLEVRRRSLTRRDARFATRHYFCGHNGRSWFAHKAEEPVA